MTSSIAQEASNGDGTSTQTKPAKKEHGLAVLREAESKGLISIVCDSLYQGSQLAHEMHSLIYARDDAEVANAQAQREQLEEALTCLQTADHYLRMLSDILDERVADSPATWPTDLAP
jgi:hypothetical protein